MYLESKMTIDPSQLTEIHHIKPTKGFARIAHLLTAGAVKSQEERETFCAVTLLQQINIVMRSAGVHNIVQLAKDETVIYEDTEGRENDLKHAIDEFAKHIPTDERKAFDTMNMILEHDADDLIVLIDIHINRSHEVGEHPIEININGLCTHLEVTEEEDSIQENMAEIFRSQSNYDSFVNSRKLSFEKLISKIEDGFVKHMNVEDVHVQSRVNIIRPSSRVKKRSDIPSSQTSNIDPIYMDHYGWDDHSYYAWIWAEQCHEHEIQCQNVVVVDSSGNEMFAVNEEGFAAGEGDTMNVDTEFTPPDFNAIDGSLLDGSNPVTSSPAGNEVAATGAGSTGSEGSGGFFSGLADSLGSMTDSIGSMASSVGDTLGSMDFGGGDGDGGGCGGGCGGG